MSKFERYQGKEDQSIYPHKHCKRCGEMIKESLTYCPDCYEVIKKKEKNKGIIKKIKSFFSRKK